MDVEINYGRYVGRVTSNFLLQAGESLMAMEDYASCSKANPANTDALLKHALHLFDEW